MIDKLLDCNCDVCEYRHYISTNDCDIRRKKAIKFALYQAIEGKISGKKYTEVIMTGEKFVPLSDVLSAIKEIFE